MRQGAPGGAWFRHQASLARSTIEKPEAAPAGREPTAARRTGELSNTYALFTGGRAMSENLQLDEVLRRAEGPEDAVDAASLPGITVREIDWTPLVEGLAPEKE